MIGALPEIWHESEIDGIEQRSFKQRANAAEQKGIELLAVDGIQEHAVVRLGVAVNLQVGGAVMSRKPQAVPAEGDCRGLLVGDLSWFDCGVWAVRVGRSG